MALFWFGALTPATPAVLSTIIVGTVNVAVPTPDTKSVAMLLDREKTPNDSVMPLVSATVVIENDASENGSAPRMPVPVPDNV
jgi:hypothetical protein